MQSDDDIKSTFNLPVDILELLSNNLVRNRKINLCSTFHESKEFGRLNLTFGLIEILFIHWTWKNRIKLTFHIGTLILLQVLLGATALTVSESYQQHLNYTYPISVQAYGEQSNCPVNINCLLWITELVVEKFLV